MKIYLFLLSVSLVVGQEITQESDFLETFTTLDQPLQEATLLILSEACSFLKIKDEENEFGVSKTIVAALSVWQKAVDMAELKLKKMLNPTKVMPEDKFDMAQQFFQYYTQLQRVLPSQSRYSFQSSTIINKIKQVPKIKLPIISLPTKTKTKKTISWWQWIKEIFIHLIDSIKKLFELDKQITHRAYDQKKCMLNLISYAISQTLHWQKNNPAQSSQASPCCTLTQLISGET